jgi:hypothetical protein
MMFHKRKQKKFFLNYRAKISQDNATAIIVLHKQINFKLK